MAAPGSGADRQNLLRRLFDAAVATGDASRSARVWRAQALAEIGLHEEAFDDLMQATGLR